MPPKLPPRTSVRAFTGARRRTRRLRRLHRTMIPTRRPSSRRSSAERLAPLAMTPLADVVAASRNVTDTPSRSGKVAILAELLSRLDSDEVPVAVGLLAGVPRQGRVGVGY